VVHAAALLGDRTPLEQYDVPTWCRVLHVNLTAPFILTQVLLANLRKSADASVIFVSSGVVQNPRPFWGAYAVAKCGLESVRSMLSQELEGEPNIRVNSVNPTVVMTEMSAFYWGRPDIGEPFLNQMPLHRWATEDDIAAPIVFLLGDGATMITGVSLPIDGGFTAC